MIRLNHTHSFLKLQTKFFKFTLCLLAKFPVNQAEFTQFAHRLREIRQPFIYPLYIMFQMHAPAENSLKFQQIKQNSLNLPTDSANDAKFAPFIYPLYIMFQMPDHWQRTL